MKDYGKIIKIFSGFSFLLAGILYTIRKNYFLGSVLIVIGVYYLLSIKKQKNTGEKTTQGKVPYDLKIELRKLMQQGKVTSQIKAINRYRKVTGGGLKEAKEYTDSLKY